MSRKIRLYYSKEKETNFLPKFAISNAPTHCLPKFAISNAPSRALRKSNLFKPPDQEMQSFSSADEHSSGESVEPNDPESENKPIPYSQVALNDLRRDVYLTKEKSEFLASRLQERNLLQKGVKITLYRKR